MNRPLVTIGVPFFNPGPFLKEAVQSVFCQTLTDWELILVNDGSSDESLEFARSITHSRVALLDDGKNLGLPARLNQIASLAQGQYLARMDADDLMHPERLERQIRCLQGHENTDVVDTGAFIIDAQRQPVGVRGLVSKPIEAQEALKWGNVLHASIVAKTQWFLQNPYSMAYPRAEDRELFIRVFKSTRVAHITRPLYFHYFHGNLRPKAWQQSYTSERRVLLRYGPALVGYPSTAHLWLRSMLKSSLLPLLIAARMGKWVTRRAFDPISDDQRHEALQTMRRITEFDLFAKHGISTHLQDDATVFCT